MNTHLQNVCRWTQIHRSSESSYLLAISAEASKYGNTLEYGYVWTLVLVLLLWFHQKCVRLDASASGLVLPARYSPLIGLLPVASLNPRKHRIAMVYCTLDASLYKAAKANINGSKCFFLNIIPKCELQFLHYHLKHSRNLYSNWTLRFVTAEQDKCDSFSVSTIPAVVGSNLTWNWAKFHVETPGSLSHILMPQLQQIPLW